MMSSYSNTSEINGTKLFSGCSSQSSLSAENVGKTFAYCFVFVVSLVGNAFITIIVYKIKTMRKTINFFIVNMAMSDLLFVLFALPLIVTELHTDSWFIGGPFGQALCKLVYLFQDLSTAVSVQSLVLITVDRFGAVVFPLRSPLISSKLCLVCVIGTWMMAIAIFCPYLFAVGLVEIPGKLVCTVQWSETFGESSNPVIFILAVSALFLYIPFSLMTVLYSIILMKVKSRKLPGEQSIKTKKQFVKRQRKVLKMAVAIVVAFALCWVPLSVHNILHLLVWDATELCAIVHYRFIALFMGRANCAVNPCICFIFSENYRQGLKKLSNCFGSLTGWSTSLRKTTEFSRPNYKGRKKTRQSIVHDDKPSNNFLMITAV